MSTPLDGYEMADDDTVQNDINRAVKKKMSSSFSPGILPRKKKPKVSEESEDPGEGLRLNKEETAFLVAEAETYVEEYEELFHSVMAHQQKEPFKVMEICCEEDSGITKAVEALGGKGIRCGLFNGCDLNKNAGFNKVAKMLRDEKPDLLWISLPCGPTSNIQELNMLTTEGFNKVQEKVRKSKRLAARAVHLMEMQVAEQRDVGQEWPRYNKAWQFKSIQNFWKHVTTYEAAVDGCAYGLRTEEGLMKKPWRVKCTSKNIWHLQRLCTCEEPHVPCEGGNRTRASALYPKAMCQQVARIVKKIHEEQEQQVFAAQDSSDNDPECLKQFTDQELMRVARELMSLHKKLGHPSRQAFVKMLRDRGASSMVRTIASNMKCMDCEESLMPPARRAVTLEHATQLWEVLQVDNMEFTVDDTTYHFQVLVDEASGYGAANFFFSHPARESRCPTGMEVLQHLHQGWIQYFGYPRCIKLDKEGAHRSKQLDEWAEAHGVELEGIPAEAHGQIGKVERLIGTLKRKLMAHLRSSSAPPELATWAMVAAHNTMSNLGGYSPMQWVFGRNPTDGDRLHDGPDLPYWAGMSSEEKMRQRLQLRLDAGQKHQEFTLNEKIKQANNTRMPNLVNYHPGDLVFYKRYQPPQDKQERSHIPLDIPRRRVARWYGPARVLALETRVTYDGDGRSPKQIAWIIASGRLKRVTSQQLRFASERERVVAESSSSTLATPWTFGDLTSLINKGEFDDVTMTHKQMVRDTQKKRAGPITSGIDRSGQQKRILEEEQAEEEDAMSTGHGENKMPRLEEDPAEESDGYTPSIADTFKDDVDIDRMINDPEYMPFSSQSSGPLFQHPQFLEARRRHEQLERPHHVQRGEFLRHGEVPGPTGAHHALYMDVDETLPAGDFEDLVFAVTIPAPKNEDEWRAIVKDPSRFVAKKVAKGVEVSWQKLNVQQRSAMTEAKALEINEWLTSRVCEGAIGKVPQDRLMKMRWVLTFKSTDDPGTLKAKARLVVLGFTDPDVGLVNVRSPTLSRRGRQLMLQATSLNNGGFLKADAKAAFLQGGPTQSVRNIYGRPVKELKEALQLEEDQAVKFLKSAYGLTVAPRDFYLYVAEILNKLKLSRLQTEPCIWRLRAPDPQTQDLRTIGLVGVHVDDFLLCGDEKHPAWVQFLEDFHKSMKWSPWETPPLVHCGVQIEETYHNGLPGWFLHQKDFCSGIGQVIEDGNTKDLTESERHQCRAVLGAAQWRVYQTAPHHAAKLSHLQSVLPKADRKIIAEINKFVREIYGQRDLGLNIYDLQAQGPDDLVAVAWSDAALANRVDLSSTGGMLIGFVHRRMVEEGQRGHVNVISWGSSKLRRVCRSSLAAETQALAEAEQELMFVRIQWREILGDEVILRDPAETAKKVRGVLVTDAKALYDAVQQGDLPSFSMKEKYSALELLLLTQNLEKQQTTLRWVNSSQQLADGLTKPSAQDALRAFLAGGQQWNILHDETFTAAKKVQKKRATRTEEEGSQGPGDPTWLDLVVPARRVTTGHVSMTASGTDTPASSTITPSLHHGSCQVGHTPMHIGSGPCFRNSFGQ